MKIVEKLHIIVLDILRETWSSGAFHMFFLTLAVILMLTATNFFLRNKLKSFFNFISLPRNEWAYLLATGTTVLALFVVYSIINGLPVPRVHDENCYLLMAKTFASGRLTNEAHPLWQFFEHFHLLNQPTYTAKYPPAQGFFLAVGILLFNHPIGGVWISGVLAAAACFWMLRAFLPPLWSFGCVLLLFTQPTVFEWSQNYWGGFVALMGGALCFGAVWRLFREISLSHGLCFGLGLVILANTRPFEGVLACFPLAFLLFYRIRKSYSDGQFLRQLFRKFLFPATLLVTANFIWMGYYNWRVTGNAFTMPYALYTRQYDPVPLFLPFSQAEIRIEYRHEVMRVFYQNEWQLHYEPLRGSAAKATLPLLMIKRVINSTNAFFYSTLIVYIGLIVYGIFVLSANRRYYFFGLSFLGCLFLETSATYNQNHYYAPFIPVILIFLAAAVWTGAQKIYGAGIKSLTHSLLPAIILVQALWVFVLPSYFKASLPDPENSQFNYERVLASLPGQHLVLVDYSTGNLTSHDGRYNQLTALSWIYNAPDIDRSRVVWANDLGLPANRQLFDYFANRHLWILGFDEKFRAKLLSCENIETPYPPLPELAETLRKNCPAN